MTPIIIAQALSSAFLAVLFLQSGIDKVRDFSGNLSWLTGYFASTFLRGLVLPMLITVTIIEVLAGLSSAIGIFAVLGGKGTEPALIGAELAALNFVMLLFGQRIAKDYNSSPNTATYFILAIVCIFVQLQA